MKKPQKDKFKNMIRLGNGVPQLMKVNLLRLSKNGSFLQHKP